MIESESVYAKFGNGYLSILFIELQMSPNKKSFRLPFFSFFSSFSGLLYSLFNLILSELLWFANFFTNFCFFPVPSDVIAVLKFLRRFAAIFRHKISLKLGCFSPRSYFSSVSKLNHSAFVFFLDINRQIFRFSSIARCLLIFSRKSQKLPTNRLLVNEANSIQNQDRSPFSDEQDAGDENPIHFK